MGRLNPRSSRVKSKNSIAGNIELIVRHTMIQKIDLQHSFDWNWIANVIDPGTDPIEIASSNVTLQGSTYGKIQISQESDEAVSLTAEHIPALEQMFQSQYFEVDRYRYRFHISLLDDEKIISNQNLADRIEMALTLHPQEV